jgi:diguanylate cyclase (GGDEF)-like protein
MDLSRLAIIPIPVALAAVCALGYFVGRQQCRVSNELLARSRRELKRARAVACELEKIAWTVRQSLAKHQASIARFKDRIGKLSGQQRQSAWKELSREVEEILEPTLQLASQMANAYGEIRQQSAHLMTFTEAQSDPLTGVNNRHGLDDALVQQLAVTARDHAPFAIAMFDIDHFKTLNDQEGQVHGDRVLRELAQLLNESARETDLVARYGGEEFVVVMPQSDRTGACLFCERLRGLVERRLRITVSGGVALAGECDTSESLLARVDLALYSAKIAGRNCVYFHNGEATEPVEPELATAAAGA